MTLYGDAKEAQLASVCAGIYHLKPMMVNEKSYWIHASGRHAIWCGPKGWWSIGPIAKAGTLKCFLYTELAVSAPQKASVWQYYSTDGKWHDGQGQVSVSLNDTGPFTKLASEVRIEYQYIKPASFESYNRCI